MDTGLKAEFIKHAGELGIPPSELLKRLVENCLAKPSVQNDWSKKGAPTTAQESASKLSLDRLLAFVHDVGRRRMGPCGYARKGRQTGKLLCWAWHFNEQDETSMQNLELVKVKEGNKEDYHAVVTPEMCGSCQLYYVKDILVDLKQLKEAVDTIYKRLGEEPLFESKSKS